MKKYNIKGKKIAVVVARFNEYITQSLLDGCLDELKKSGVKKTNIATTWVPGAWEIPVVALKFAKKKNIHAVICLGAVIQGETPHFHFVSKGCCDGIQQIAIATGKPAILGVLTTTTVRQAEERSKKKGHNKGREAAIAALETLDVLSKN